MSLPDEYLRLPPGHQKAAISDALEAYRTAAPGFEKEAGRKALLAYAVEVEPEVAGQTGTPMWIPFRNGRLQRGLAVAYGEQYITRERYENLLRARLTQQIEVDYNQAHALLTGSVEHMPGLYSIGIYSNREHWAIQIMISDEMMICLNEIQWTRGISLSLAEDEMPSLADFCEAL